MTPHDAMQRIDALLSHVWMVRTFLKHSDESENEESLQDVFRDLYDYMLSLGPAWTAQDADAYLKLAHKKLGKLRAATARFVELQPEISTHTNFQMAARSLVTAVEDVARIVGEGKNSVVSSQESEGGGRKSEVGDGKSEDSKSQ